MEFIDDWVNYVFDPNKYILEEEWDNLSLQYVSDEITEKYKDKLNWSIIASNWQIDQQFYEKFRRQLDPCTQILKLRQQHGFLSIILKD